MPRRHAPGSRFRKSGYHHGNLREALVSAARVLILEKGPHGFSLIEAARLADVSPAAPYRHFKDRKALLAEVARRGFDLFADRLERAWDGGVPDRATALKRLGHAYLDFAQTERAYYTAMFQAGIAVGDDADLQAAADRAYRSLAAVTAGLDGAAGDGRAVPADAVFFHIWSLAHGAATLTRGGATGGMAPEELLDLGVDLYLQGLGIGQI